MGLLIMSGSLIFIHEFEQNVVQSTLGFETLYKAAALG